MTDFWNHEQARTVLAWALWEAGLIRWAEAMIAMDDSRKVPVFRCQGAECFRVSECCPRCGAKLKRDWVGDCAECIEAHDEIYLSSGKRRIIRPNENE